MAPYMLKTDNIWCYCLPVLGTLHKEIWMACQLVDHRRQRCTQARSGVPDWLSGGAFGLEKGISLPVWFCW